MLADKHLAPSPDGYYRFPAIHGDTLVFASEDDLWAVPAAGGVARRLTSGLGTASHPAFSLDGSMLAFSGREEGCAEVYVMPAAGGQPRRLTYVGAGVSVVGWMPAGRIVFATTAGQPFHGLARVYSVSHDADASPNLPELLPTGPAVFASFPPNSSAASGCVIARPSMADPAYWKRYRGGTAGDLWIDSDGDGMWRRLLRVEGNPSRPLWLATPAGDRIYFTSDHEGVGNLYSCTPRGEGLRRHTHHDDFYVRGAATDGRRIVYHAGADLYVYDPATDTSTKVPVEYHGPRTQRGRRFVEAAKYLESYSPHPQGHLLAITTRGQIRVLGHIDGPVLTVGEPHVGRYRLAAWLHDGKRLVAVSDAEGKETLTVHSTDTLAPTERVGPMDLGRVVGLRVSPKTDHVALSNVRNELILVDLAGKTSKVLDRSEHAPIFGFNFSPDGRWLAYSWNPTLHTTILKLCRLADGAIFPVTRPVLMDLGPAWDPEGKYLYFLSRREFDPVYDQLHFDLSFPKGMRPYLLTLRKDIPSPFPLVPKPPEEKKEEKKEEAKEDAQSDAEKEPAKDKDAAKDKDKELVIDLDGIEDRIQAFPVPEGIYLSIEGIKGKALFTSSPVQGAIGRGTTPGGEPPAKAVLESFDFEAGKAETVVSGISDFQISLDRKTLVYRAGHKLRAFKADGKPDDTPGRKSGWVDLKRVRVGITPPDEWRQMFGEAWRLQHEQFWVEDMAGVDWAGVFKRYRPLLDRVSTRSEFADLLWEMQGELGASHAYVMGGDYRREPEVDLGFLGADLAWEPSADGGESADKTAAGLWKIASLLRGDSWDDERGSPLLRPGVNVREGDTILAVNGRATARDFSPAQLLVNQAGLEVSLTVGDPAGQSPRTVMVKTLRGEMPLRYRAWVEKNREYVHQKTNGKCGYVHIPNMGPWGYAEFHRYFLSEVDRDGLLIDVRFNGGGHVSALLLEKLARRRMAYVRTRWFGVHPWPEDSAAGPMVALTNEFAGSDGDIFSHNFKAMKLGPLIGKRTWGGVIGIWPRHTLVDGGVTTQPEFSFWFKDIGWQVENYGVDPDIEVEYPPQAYNAGNDPQMDRGLEELMKRVDAAGTVSPLPPVPSRAWPKAKRTDAGTTP